MSLLNSHHNDGTKEQGLLCKRFVLAQTNGYLYPVEIPGL